LIAGDDLLAGLTGVVCPFYTVGLENMQFYVCSNKKNKRGFSMHGKLWKLVGIATQNLLHSVTC